MRLDSQIPEVVRFGPFELTVEDGQLRKNGVRIRLSGQPVQVLMLLLATPGRLVTREQLQSALWNGNTYGDSEKGLNNAVNRLRESLGDSPTDPKYIETIPGRGYRFIAELEQHSHGGNSEPPVSPLVDDSSAKSINRLNWRRALFVIGALVLCVVGIGFWNSPRINKTPSVKEPSFIQITRNSIDNPITSSAISPDGRYLAFTDNSMRIHIRHLETGETETLAEPEALKGIAVHWNIAAWFPDSSRFLVNAQSAGIWIVSLIGKIPQKLRDDAEAFAVSPDGSLIAFGTNDTELGTREIWLMDEKGLQARKLFEAPEKTAIGNFRWSADGQRAIYLEVRGATGQLVSRDLRGGPVVPLIQYSGWWSLTDFVSLPDGRVIYARDGNLWEVRIDPRSGKTTGIPRQLTNWSRLWLGKTSVTSDGKRLAFQRSAGQSTVNIARIEANGTHLSPAKHFTLNDYPNSAQTWTPDSKSLVFVSNREGHPMLFKQALDSDTEEPLVMGAKDVEGAAISPDGSWLFYEDDAQGEGGVSSEGPVPVMRIPMQGGEPRQVLTSDTYGRPRCTFSPAKLCVIAEQNRDGKRLIFTSFDALKGRGREIASFETDPAVDEYHWGLSPDGSSIAILQLFGHRIHVISLKGEPRKEVAVKGWTNLESVYWAADGKGWFTVSKTPERVVLLYVDLTGEAHPLWETTGDPCVYGLPSPDGKYLAVVATPKNSNVWIMGNF